jgi:uncharacterized protein
VTERLSLATARRIALAAQGFADPRPTGAVDRRHLRRVLSRTRLLQIDSVNVFARAHVVPPFSRLGPWPLELLPDLLRRREVFEYWAHEASLLPVELHPLLRWRMADARDGTTGWGGVLRVARERPDFVAAVLGHVRERGPLGAGELREAPREGGSWWAWDDAKVALEYLFWAGEVTTARRTNGFERLYDVTERVLPAAVLDLPTPTRDEAVRELVRLSAAAHGVAVEKDLRDYFRLPREDAAAAVRDLADAGELQPVEVEGWKGPAYLWPGARVPRRVRASALLSPFDPLVWERSRTSRLFGFDYRIEIYVPAEKRVHGYYVLPFLHDELLRARVDLKADRKAGALLVQAAHAEPSCTPETVEALAGELRRAADWLGLSDVQVVPRGDLAGPLKAVLA